MTITMTTNVNRQMCSEAREGFLKAIIAWRREREQSEARLRNAEHSLATALAELLNCERLTETCCNSHDIRIA